MKTLRLALVVASGLIALSCTQLFSKLDNPADGKAVNYQGYPTVSDPGAINPGKPSSSSPSLFAPKLVATKVSGAERYHFQVASSKDFSPASIAHQNDAATSNEYLPVAWSGYDTSAAYYWRVRAYKDGAWGPWSTQLATFSFTSPNAGSTIPVDASAVNSPTPTFDWSDMEGAIGYRIQVSALADFSIIADHSETLTESAYVLGSNLANSTTWYWRVAAKGVDGSWSAYAPTLSFSTLFPAALAPKILPAAGSYSSDQSVTISCETKDAVIHYTTDGSAPSAESAVYSEAIAVAGHGTKTTIKAYAASAITSQSAVSSALISIDYGTTSSPEFSPVAGSFASDQSVTLSCQTANAAIYYSLDGSTPTSSSTLYKVTIPVAGNGTSTTIKAIAIAPGKTASGVSSGTWTIAYPRAAAPTFSPAAGSFSSDQSVTISSASSGATIYYTVDGTAPTTSSLVYSSAIGIVGHGTSTTIKAIAVSSGTSLSLESSALYTINYSTTSVPEFSPVAGSFASDQSVTLSCQTANAVIYYSLDGSTPTSSSTLYKVTIPVAGNGTSTTIKAIAIAPGKTASGVSSGTWTIAYPRAAAPTFSPAAGSFSSDQSVTISSASSGATIYYTVDGTAPTTASSVYTGAISAAGHGTSTIIKAIAISSGTALSAVESGTYAVSYLTASTPSFSPLAGNKTTDTDVTISCATAGAKIYYTTDGSTPTTASQLYAGEAIHVTGHGTSKTIKALATATCFLNSLVGTGSYTINYPAAATPSFGVAGGTYTSAQSVTISTTTSGATIYYTTDGTVPTSSSAVYSSAVSLGGTGTTKTLKAIAISATTSVSVVASAAYSFSFPAAASPTFSPAAGTYSSAQSVSISTTTGSATIYYTTDGTAPTTSSSVYSSAVSLGGNGTTKTLKAIAISPTTSSSATASAAYTFNYPLAATPTFSPVAGTYASDQSIALTTTTPNATIYYTTNNTTPTSSSAVYSTPISIAGHGTSMVIQAKAISATTSLSSAASGTFTIAYPAAATPTFNPPGGVYTSTQSVTISSTTAGATIWYTTDGSDPTSSATRLSGASPVASVSAPLGKTLRAEATATSILTSAEGTAVYSKTLALAFVAGGTFNNGTSDVTVSSFTMSTYEITQAQYLTVTGNSPSYFTTVTGGPVEQVTWYDAVEFCNKLSTRESRTPVYTISGRTPATGYPITSASVTATWTNNGYRLPTEAEWEYAARGGASTHGYTYAGSSTLDGVAWYSTNSASKTHAVGGKTANELGLYDMSGNVWEWCWDWYGTYPTGTQTNPTGASEGSYRVLRGGSWNAGTGYGTVSYRSYDYPYGRYGILGFRVVAPPSP